MHDMMRIALAIKPTYKQTGLHGESTPAGGAKTGI
jgi:hypothetical protein